MAGSGRKVTFHGAYKSKEDAKRKEKQVHGYIEEVTVRGHRRYAVITRKG